MIAAAAATVVVVTGRLLCAVILRVQDHEPNHTGL